MAPAAPYESNATYTVRRVSHELAFSEGDLTRGLSGPFARLRCCAKQAALAEPASRIHGGPFNKQA